MSMKFSMNGFRKQLSNDVHVLKNMVSSVVAGEFYEIDDLINAMNDVIRHSNVINCVYQKGDPDFRDMSTIEIDYIDDSN